MKKGLVLLLTVAVLVMSVMTVHAAPFAPEIYTSQSVYIEEEYRGDCWDGVCDILVLLEDGTYLRVENTSIIQAAGAVVTYWTYSATGTYEVVEEDEEIKIVKLSAPEKVYYVMNDAETTSEEDEELLEYFEEEEIEIDLVTLKF